jgi:ABC-type enterochelin transport system permease subunit
MRSGRRDCVEELTACGLVAQQVVPGRFPNQTDPGCTNWAALGTHNAALSICYELENC